MHYLYQRRIYGCLYALPILLPILAHPSLLKIRKSQLGAGINIQDPDGPNQTGTVVLADVRSSQISCMNGYCGEEVVITQSRQIGRAHV